MEDYGCIARIFVNVKDHSIKSADIPTVDKLFSDNKIDNSNYRYTGYGHDTFQLAYTPYTKYDEKYVRVVQFAKGLQVYGSERTFLFWDGIIKDSVPNPVDVSALDTVPHTTLPRLRELFKEDLKKSYTFMAKYADSCFDAEFCFYKLREYGKPDKFLKAWRVTARNQPYYPMGLYDDTEGKKIYFSSGIIPY